MTKILILSISSFFLALNSYGINKTKVVTCSHAWHEPDIEVFFTDAKLANSLIELSIELIDTKGDTSSYSEAVSEEYLEEVISNKTIAITSTVGYGSKGKHYNNLGLVIQKKEALTFGSDMDQVIRRTLTNGYECKWE